MHIEVRNFIRKVKKEHPKFFRFTRVLEVGSQNINGSVREHFFLCEYIGLDLGPGKKVDLVCHGADFKTPGLFDVVISCEALEHDRRWNETLLQMYENLKPGGLLI